MTDMALLGGDPAPGDPAGIRGLGCAVGAVSEAAFEASVALDKVGGDIAVSGWTGEAAVAFDLAFADLPPDLRSMARSYHDVDAALRAYADTLEDLKVKVDHALARAKVAAQAKSNASATRESARRTVGALQRQVGQLRQDEANKSTALTSAPPTDPCRPTLEWETNEAIRLRRLADQRLGDARSSEVIAGEAIEKAECEVSAARTAADAIRAQRASAEKTCESAIRDALARDLRNKSMWEKIQAAPGKLLDAIGNIDWDRIVARLRDVLGKLSTVLGIIALLLAATGIGGPLAAIVALAAAICAVAKLLCTATLMARGAKGVDGKPITWGDMAWDTTDAVFAVAGVSALKGAKSLTGAGKQLKGGVASVRSGARIKFLEDVADRGLLQTAGRNVLRKAGVDGNVRRVVYPTRPGDATGFLRSLDRGTRVATFKVPGLDAYRSQGGGPAVIRVRNGLKVGTEGFRDGYEHVRAVQGVPELFTSPRAQPPRVSACYAGAA